MSLQIMRLTKQGTSFDTLRSLEDLIDYSFNGETFIGQHCQFAAGSQVHLYLDGPNDKIRIWKSDYSQLKKEYQSSDTHNPKVDSLIESIENYLAQLNPEII